MLTVYLVLLCAIPSNLTNAALGSIGRPAILWGLGCALWWFWTTAANSMRRWRRRQPVRIALLCFALLALLTFGVAQLNGLPSEEISPANSALLGLISWAGIILIANDGITERERFVVLLHRIAVAGGLLALLGLVQFVTGKTLIDMITIPGFGADADLSALQNRSGFTRSSATASHPLEYAVVLSSALPIALAFALADNKKSFAIRWSNSIVILLAALLSVSRSAILGVVAGVAILLPSWPARARRAAGICGILIGIGIYLLVPGMAGTIFGLFEGASTDSSTVSRTNGYGLALEIAGHYFPLGRGLGTFIPRYQILDNQFLGLLIEVGVVGLIAFVGLLVTAVTCAGTGRRDAVSATDRHLCLALIAAIVSTSLLFAFFDAFSFPMARGMLGLLIGLSGAARNIYIWDRHDKADHQENG